MLNRRTLLGYFSALPFVGMIKSPSHNLPELKFAADRGITNAEELLAKAPWHTHWTSNLVLHTRHTKVWLPQDRMMLQKIWLKPVNPKQPWTPPASRGYFWGEVLLVENRTEANEHWGGSHDFGVQPTSNSQLKPENLKLTLLKGGY